MKPEPKPKPPTGRPRKTSGEPKSPYTMTEAARKARRKAGKAGSAESKRKAWQAMIVSQAAKLEKQ